VPIVRAWAGRICRQTQCCWRPGVLLFRHENICGRDRSGIELRRKPPGNCEAQAITRMITSRLAGDLLVSREEATRSWPRCAHVQEQCLRVFQPERRLPGQCASCPATPGFDFENF
jgi:hypothetical protein